jgi:hypothetical protein
MRLAVAWKQMARARGTWTAVSAVVFFAVAGSAAQSASAVPRGVAVDHRYPTPYGTILRGHARDLGAIADLLEDLGRPPAAEEPILRQISRSGQGYEYSIVVPSGSEPIKQPVEELEPLPIPWIGAVVEGLFSIPLERWTPETSRPTSAPRTEYHLEHVTRKVAGESPLAGVSINDLAVEAIYQTSVGGVMRARAHGRHFLLRDGDRLSDGDVQGIRFVRPAVARVRCRQRVEASPCIPYRPVVWVLGARDRRPRAAGGQELGRGLAIGGPGSPPADPGGRRDPFLDLSDPMVPPHDDRHPAGIPGLLIDSLEVTGLFISPVGPVAEVRDPKGFFYFLEKGDRLWDGDVARIDLREGVIFRQVENDPAALKPFREVVKTVDPRSIGAPGASCETWAPWPEKPRRDPFRSLRSGDTTVESPPSALAGLTCASLTWASSEQISDVVERADRRRARYSWEKGLLALSGDGAGPWKRRFREDIAKAASSDLAGLLDDLLFKPSFRAGPVPPPAEMFALLGDFDLIVGRLQEAAESYAVAEQIHPGQKTLCGRLFAGRLYGAEDSTTRQGWDGRHRMRLSGYLLAWDLASGRVVERHALPTGLQALAIDHGALDVALEGGGNVRIPGRGFVIRVPGATRLSDRSAGIASGERLAANFDLRRAPACSWTVGERFDEELPLDLAELERATRAAAARDPTQPWHPFLLGQALWAQGRRKEAETVWRDMWDRGRWVTPSHELTWMAAFHERCGQRDWSDRVFAAAMEQRRATGDRGVASSIDRILIMPLPVWDRLRDPERRYLWWRRLREATGIEGGDAFRAMAWAEERLRRGDGSHARDELAYLERARRNPREWILRSAWLDYSFYGLAACAAMLFAQSAVLGRRIIRRLRRRRFRWPGWSRALKPLLHLPAVLLIAVVFYLALSLVPLAASYLYSLWTAPHEVEGPSISSDLWHAWLTTGALQREHQEPLPFLLQKVREIRSLGAGAQVLLGLGGLAALFVIVQPAGLLLAWSRARRVSTRWIPGAALVRAGARLRGYVVFGLFVFAVGPLSWLVITRACGPVPAPGPASAHFLATYSSPRVYMPLPGGDPQRAIASRRLRTRLFFRFLAVYPAAWLFWSLVVGALVISVGVHVKWSPHLPGPPLPASHPPLRERREKA